MTATVDKFARLSAAGRPPAGSVPLTRRIQAGLADRTWSLPDSSRKLALRGECQAFFLFGGSAVLTFETGTRNELPGPCLVWLPQTAATEFCAIAGSEGFHLSVTDDYALRTLCDTSFAPAIRPMLSQITIAPADKLGPPVVNELTASFEALARESRDPGPVAPLITGLHLGIVLVHLWLTCGARVSSQATRGSGAATVQRFAQLIELHYRENLRIDTFASLMGVTRAHLHQACIAVTGRTPLTLVHERIVEEAKLKLNSTDLSIEQVGYALGFRDPPYFHRFFKRLTNASPATFRQSSRGKAVQTPAPFTDWL